MTNSWKDLPDLDNKESSWKDLPDVVEQAPVKEPEKGLLDNASDYGKTIASNVAKGASFGTVDEIAGAIKAFMTTNPFGETYTKGHYLEDPSKKSEPQDIQESYEQARDWIRSQEKESETRDPKLALASEVVGTMLSPNLAGKISFASGTSKLSRLARLMKGGEAAKSALTAGTTGALRGVTTSEGDTVDKLKSGLSEGALSALLGGALGKTLGSVSKSGKDVIHPKLSDVKKYAESLGLDYSKTPNVSLKQVIKDINEVIPKIGKGIVKNTPLIGPAAIAAKDAILTPAIRHNLGKLVDFFTPLREPAEKAIPIAVESLGDSNVKKGLIGGVKNVIDDLSNAYERAVERENYEREIERKKKEEQK